MSVPPQMPMDAQPATVLPCAYPLDEFYALGNRDLPVIEPVPGDAVPEPYRRLLVHLHDMTPTLEEFHGDRIHLNVISRQHRGDFYFREVVLFTDRTKTPVEFGAIKINLALFPAAARRLILEEQEPLGTILNESKIAHTSCPKAFLRLQSDAFINGALKLRGRHTLFGRRNTLFDPQQHALAEIVEILPPAEKRS